MVPSTPSEPKEAIISDQSNNNKTQTEIKDDSLSHNFGGDIAAMVDNEGRSPIHLSLNFEYFDHL